MLAINFQSFLGPSDVTELHRGICQHGVNSMDDAFYRKDFYDYMVVPNEDNATWITRRHQCLNGTQRDPLWTQMPRRARSSRRQPCQQPTPILLQPAVSKMPLEHFLGSQSATFTLWGSVPVEQWGEEMCSVQEPQTVRLNTSQKSVE